MARKNTSRRDPIGSTSEALSRQRTRQSLRKHIVDAHEQGLQMDTENLVIYIKFKNSQDSFYLLKN